MFEHLVDAKNGRKVSHLVICHILTRLSARVKHQSRSNTSPDSRTLKACCTDLASMPRMHPQNPAKDWAMCKDRYHVGAALHVEPLIKEALHSPHNPGGGGR